MLPNLMPGLLGQPQQNFLPPQAGGNALEFGGQQPLLQSGPPQDFNQLGGQQSQGMDPFHAQPQHFGGGPLEFGNPPGMMQPGGPPPDFNQQNAQGLLGMQQPANTQGAWPPQQQQQPSQQQPQQSPQQNQQPPQHQENGPGMQRREDGWGGLKKQEVLDPQMQSMYPNQMQAPNQMGTLHQSSAQSSPLHRSQGGGPGGMPMLGGPTGQMQFQQNSSQQQFQQDQQWGGPVPQGQDQWRGNPQQQQQQQHPGFIDGGGANLEFNADGPGGVKRKADEGFRQGFVPQHEFEFVKARNQELENELASIKQAFEEAKQAKINLEKEKSDMEENRQKLKMALTQLIELV